MKLKYVFEKFTDFVDNKTNVLTEPDTRIREKVSVYLNINGISNTVFSIWEEGAKLDIYPNLISIRTMSYIVNDIRIEINIEKREILSYKGDSLLTFEKMTIDNFIELIRN